MSPIVEDYLSISEDIDMDWEVKSGDIKGKNAKNRNAKSENI